MTWEEIAIGAMIVVWLLIVGSFGVMMAFGVVVEIIDELRRRRK